MAAVGNRDGVQWVWWWWHSIQLAMDYGKAVARRKWLAQREDKKAAQEEATQQPAGTMRVRGQEGGTTRGLQEMMQQPAGVMR